MVVGWLVYQRKHRMESLLHGLTTTTALPITMKTDRLNVSMSFIRSLFLPLLLPLFFPPLSDLSLCLMERERDDCVCQ